VVCAQPIEVRHPAYEELQVRPAGGRPSPLLQTVRTPSPFPLRTFARLIRLGFCRAELAGLGGLAEWVAGCLQQGVSSSDDDNMSDDAMDGVD